MLFKFIVIVSGENFKESSSSDFPNDRHRLELKAFSTLQFGQLLT